MESSEEDERKLKNLATRIMSNGVEVLVKDKNSELTKQDQRKIKFMHNPALKSAHFIRTSLLPKQSLISSAVATVVNYQLNSAMPPLQQLMHHSFIIKTCLTTFTYLTTVIQNKRSTISTFETIVSVVTTESLTNIYATDVIADIKPTKTKFMEIKTIHPTAITNTFQSLVPKSEKRIDNDLHSSLDLIQPSEVDHVPCTKSCSCSDTKTEGLKTKHNSEIHNLKKIPLKTSKIGLTKVDVRPTSMNKKSSYRPYEYESSLQSAPTDKIVEKYTEVINDYSDEKESISVEDSELLTNEQAPAPSKLNKVDNHNTSEKVKPDKPQKPSKNKFVVADLLKLGSLGIKSLSHLAPVIEKMTGGFIKRQDNNKATTTTSKPVTKITPYNANKRIDSEMDTKQINFPIYIPVDEMEMSESQLVFTNATLHQNIAWAAEHKHPKTHVLPPKMIHESALVNGGIPISPGEIITANSDVIVGKPAVGGPLTLVASGIRLQNPVNPPVLDTFMSGNEHFVVQELPINKEKSKSVSKVDDTYDLRPPKLPKSKGSPNRNVLKTNGLHTEPNQHSAFDQQNYENYDSQSNPSWPHSADNLMKTEHMEPTMILGNHGRPAFLDYIPSLAKPENNFPPPQQPNRRPTEEIKDLDIPDNSPSSSEILSTRVKTNGELVSKEPSSNNKQFLVDIQPSRVANVLIPHGSSTALVFAGSSEPHKTGDYIDDPLPYPEPGYFGSFNIDAPQLTNVHNVPTSHNYKVKGVSNNSVLDVFTSSTNSAISYKNEPKPKWKENKRPFNYDKLPPPTSNQETHLHIGPQITVYNPDIYKPANNGKFEIYNEKYSKDIIDKEYENYLAVPPPPPPKVSGSNDHYDKNKYYSQKPIVHTKPVQDMKVFLNVQHPIPKKPHNIVTKQEKLPPRVTSEIYFAAQAPSHSQMPTYTMHIPNAESDSSNHYNQLSNNKYRLHANNNQHVNNFQSQHHHTMEQGSFTGMSSSSFANNKPEHFNNLSNKDNVYTITLNTATNVANHAEESGQILGSSFPLSINVPDNDKTDIPVETNFAIRVEDEQSKNESYDIPIKTDQVPSISYEVKKQEPFNTANNNKWNSSKNTDNFKDEKSSNNIYSSTSDTTTKNSFKQENIESSINSHANFPIINELSTEGSEIVKPVTEYVDDTKSEQKRPAKLIPNIPTNSHGWYSSMPENEFNTIDSIKLEVTTRKAIPLLYDYSFSNLPDFGQKITTAGRPPSEFWSLSNSGTVSDTMSSTQKPLTYKNSNDQTLQFKTKPLQTNYIPQSLGAISQPVYDIPVIDNSDETTTAKVIVSSEKLKPVYENVHEIYDGQEETDINVDGEVSQESMKVAVVSESKEKDNQKEYLNELTEKTPGKEILQDSQNNPVNKEISESDNNLGSQTEKSFDMNSYNRTSTFQSNNMRPIYENKSQMKPRPFTINTATTLDHQLQQPHWQINQLMENSSNVSYEENLELNLGEEISTISTLKFNTHKIPYQHDYGNKYSRPPRPVFSLRPANGNDSIITSTVHIQDKKPLALLDETDDKSSTSATQTISNYDFNNTSSEIIDLSPPPPTMDYNFKPSSTDETIMGMSPPPPVKSLVPLVRNGLPTRAPITPRPGLPVRTPPPYRTKPIRTLPPRVSSQRPNRKPITRDEVSTYRPSYDIINHIKKPIYSRNELSSQLLPPSREIPLRASPLNEIISSPTKISNVIFPTPVSSGWLTSSGIEFSSKFSPTSVLFPQSLPSSIAVEFSGNSNTEKISSSDQDSSISTEYSYEKNVVSTESSDSKETNADKISQSSREEVDISDTVSSETTVKNSVTNTIKVIPLRNNNRTRKPFPTHEEDRKSSTSRFRLQSNSSSTIIKPTRTFSRPEIIYPTRNTSIRKIIRPMQTRSSLVVQPSLIESSESSIDAMSNNEYAIPIASYDKKPLITEKTPNLDSAIIHNRSQIIMPTHHAGNEIKISDEIIATKTEFRTTVVTLTKTLSEPPKTVSSIGYVNLTHTLTVTHTKTSLVSQSEGAVTQTLILTNTHTSTLVDVITEIHTQVQPTTIIETVTKHIPIPQIEPTTISEIASITKIALDDISMSSEEKENFIIRNSETTENIQKIDQGSENETDTFFVVMNKSQNGGQSPHITTDIETSEYDGITRNEQVNSNGVSQVLFGEILLAGTPYLETTNVVHSNGGNYGKDCQPDCKASRNERCQRIDGVMKCVCRPGFARMFPDRPCKPTYTYSVNLALSSQGNERLLYHDNLADNSSSQYNSLALATHEGINRMVMQSDLRDVYHGVHITGFQPVEVKKDDGDTYQGVMNDFYVQLSDNAHESRLKEVIEKYLRNNNYSLGGTEVFAASELMDRLNVSDFDECVSGQFHDCSEHAQCFNLRGTYTCSCLEGFADLSVNSLYPGRICSAEPVGCERCNYHGACYSRDDRRVLCECFQWYAGSSCHINLKVVLISLVTVGALLTVVLVICAVIACSKRPRPPPRSIVTCIQSMPGIHQGAQPSKQRADRRALINERADSGDASSLQNASLPYMPAKKLSSSKKLVVSEPPPHEAPPPPPPAVMIPRARFHPTHRDSREMASRKQSLELSSEAKLISYLESGANANTEEMMRRKHSMESSYSAPKERHNKQGALVSAGFKVSTTIRPDEPMMREDRDDLSSINKNDLESELAHFDSLRKSYSQEDISEWTDAERRIGELTLSEARSVGGTLPASTGRAASSTRLTHQEANTMAERDLGSTFLLPHVHLYKPDITSDVSEFDSL